MLSPVYLNKGSSSLKARAKPPWPNRLPPSGQLRIFIDPTAPVHGKETSRVETLEKPLTWTSRALVAAWHRVVSASSCLRVECSSTEWSASSRLRRRRVENIELSRTRGADIRTARQKSSKLLRSPPALKSARSFEHILLVATIRDRAADAANIESHVTSAWIKTS